MGSALGYGMSPFSCIHKHVARGWVVNPVDQSGCSWSLSAPAHNRYVPQEGSHGP